MGSEREPSPRASPAEPSTDAGWLAVEADVGALHHEYEVLPVSRWQAAGGVRAALVRMARRLGPVAERLLGPLRGQLRYNAANTRAVAGLAIEVRALRVEVARLRERLDATFDQGDLQRATVDRLVRRAEADLREQRGLFAGELREILKRVAILEAEIDRAPKDG